MALADFAPHNLTTPSSNSPFLVRRSSESSFGYAYRAFDGDNTKYWLGVGNKVDWLELCLDRLHGTSILTVNAVTDSTHYGSYTGDKTIDGDIDSFWIGTNNAVDWVRYDFGSGNSYKVTKYYIRVNRIPEATRAPKDWKLQGSNDASAWTDVDTVTGQTSWASGETRYFTCDSSATAYRYYRVNITANNGASTYTQYAEIGFYQDLGGTPTKKKLYSYDVKVNSVPEASRAPKAWTMQGSNDAETWDTIDTVTAQTSWGSGESRNFVCDTYTTSYQWFRINISDNNGDSTYVQIQELYLYEDDAQAVTGSSGITSAEAFGTTGGEVALSSAPQTVTGSAGVASAEAFSAGVLYAALALVGSAGVVSAEAFSAGAFIWDLYLTGESGIPSAEAAGDGIVVITTPIDGVAGISSEEAFGIGSFILVLTNASGIASAEAFSAGVIAGAILGVAGIPSEETFTNGVLSSNIIFSLVGIVSEEAFSIGALGYIGGPVEGVSGIVSAEAFGIGVISGPVVGVSGIASAEAFGVGELLTRIIGLSGIASAEAFGSGGVLTRSTVGLSGIASEEAFGKTGILLMFSPGEDNTAPSNFVVYVGTSLWTQYMKADSIKVEQQVNYQSSCTFEMIDSSQVIWPRRGDEVIIYHYDEDLSPDKPGDNEWHRIFAGTIESMEINGDWVGDKTRFITVSCTDYGRGLSKRLLHKVFDEKTYGSLTKIMQYLNSTILKEEGLTWVSKGDPGIVIGDIEFDYTPLNEVMDKLSEIVGWTWLTDYYRNLYIYDKPTEQVSAPFDISEETTGTNAYMWRNLKVTHSRGLFRNRQYVRLVTAAGEDGGEIIPPEDPDPDDGPTIVVKKIYTIGTWKANPEALISLRRQAWDTSPLYYQDELQWVPNGNGGWHWVTRTGQLVTDKVTNGMAIKGVIAATQEDMQFFANNPPINYAPRIVDGSQYAADSYNITSPWYRGGKITSLKVNGVSKVVTGLDGRNPSTGLFDVDWMCPLNTGYTVPANALHFMQWYGTEFELGSNGGRSLVCYYIGKIIDPLNSTKVHPKYGDSIEITWESAGTEAGVPETYTHTYVMDVPRDVNGYPDQYTQGGTYEAGNLLRLQGTEERIGYLNGPYNTFGVGAVLYDEAFEGKVRGIQSIKRNGVEEVIIKSYYPGVTPSTSAEWVWTPGSSKIIGRHVWQTDYWRNNLGLYGGQANVSMVGHDIEYPLSARVAKQPVWGDVIEVEWLIPDTTQPPGDPIDVPDDPADPGEDPVDIPTIGIWEAVDDLPGVTDPVLIKKFAKAMLKKFSVPGVEVEFETYRLGLSPGQETTITLNKYGVYNMTAKVESITSTEEGMRLLKQNVKISNTIQGRDALNAFNRLLKKLNKPSQAQKSTITFHLAETIPGIPNPGLVTGTSLGAVFIARRDITLIDGVVFFKTAPTGAPIQMDIKVDGESIFTPGHGVVYPAGSTALKTFSLFKTNPYKIKKNARVTIDVISTGSEQPGKDGTLVLSGWVF